MIRQAYCELILREIYRGQPNADAVITMNQVNAMINPALAAFAKMNYVENKRTDNIEYINDSFFLTFADRDIFQNHNENFSYYFSLPHIPVAIGANLGISTVELLSPNGAVSQSIVMCTADEWARRKTARRIPNKILGTYEGKTFLLYTTLPLYNYKGKVRMVSGGATTDLTSELNVPDDFFKFVVTYIKEELAFELSRPADAANDGKDKA